MRVLIFTLLALNSINVYSQQDTISTDVIWPLGLANKGDFLYVAEADVNSISRINLTDDNLTKEIILTNLQRPNHLYIEGNDLYYTEYNGRKISKVDLEQLPNVIPQDIVTGLNQPKDIHIYEDNLYYSEPTKIFKVDLTSQVLAPLIVLENLGGPIGLAIKENVLYYSEYSGGIISKLDLSQPNISEIVISGLNTPLGGIEIKGTDLYYSEYNNKIISKIDISAPNALPITVESNFESSDILFINNDLYLSDNDNNLIVRYTNIITSLTNEIDQHIPIFAYPNPTQGVINIEGKERNKNQVFVINPLGKIVKQLSNNFDGEYNLTDLPRGDYFLIIEGYVPFKIIKH